MYFSSSTLKSKYYNYLSQANLRLNLSRMINTYLNAHHRNYHCPIIVTTSYNTPFYVVHTENIYNKFSLNIYLHGGEQLTAGR